MSDCFNQCPSCDLILSVRSSDAEVTCPRCWLNEGARVTMHLVALDKPLRPRFGPTWGKTKPQNVFRRKGDRRGPRAA